MTLCQNIEGYTIPLSAYLFLLPNLDVSLWTWRQIDFGDTFTICLFLSTK